MGVTFEDVELQILEKLQQIHFEIDAANDLQDIIDLHIANSRKLFEDINDLKNTIEYLEM